MNTCSTRVAEHIHQCCAGKLLWRKRCGFQNKRHTDMELSLTIFIKSGVIIFIMQRFT